MAGLKLLVVEDDLPSLELMTEVFQSMNAEVCPINDSRKAAFLVNQQKFDGIFLDLEMPSLHGLELAQTVRDSSWNKLTPIVIVTGHDERNTMQKSFASGAQFFLQKPVDRQKLGRLFRTVRGTMIENRRRATRVPLQTNVTCTTTSRSLRGRTWNLSEGGLQVEVAGLRTGEAVELHLGLPGSPVVIDASGTVVWVKENREGIQFTKINSLCQEQIRDFIAQVEKH